MAEVIIHNDNFTDENGHIHYLNTGRDNVSGLAYPTHYVRNKDDHFYTRILLLKLSRDTSLIYPIHECFLLTTFTKGNVSGISNIVTIDALVKEGTVKNEDIKITCTPLNSSDLMGGKIHTITAATKGELDSNGNIVNNLGIWLHSKDIVDIVIKDLSSLSFNGIPNNIYHQFLQCDYESHFLNNEDIIYDVNMFNFEESIGVKVGEAVNVNQLIIDKLQKVNDTVVVEPENYKFLSVIYDDMYAITDINIDETIKPTAFQYVHVDNSFATINNDYVQVNEDGNYLIALKVNMDILEGEATKMMISFFLNDDRINEMTSSLYLDPSNKVHPLGFLAGQAQIQLKSSDKLYLKARWTEKANIENHCTLQITKLS